MGGGCLEDAQESVCVGGGREKGWGVRSINGIGIKPSVKTSSWHSPSDLMGLFCTPVCNIQLLNTTNGMGCQHRTSRGGAGVSFGQLNQSASQRFFV